jgi:hypothetical protein
MRAVRHLIVAYTFRHHVPYASAHCTSSGAVETNSAAGRDVRCRTDLHAPPVCRSIMAGDLCTDQGGDAMLCAYSRPAALRACVLPIRSRDSRIAGTIARYRSDGPTLQRSRGSGTRRSTFPVMCGCIPSTTEFLRHDLRCNPFAPHCAYDIVSVDRHICDDAG